MVDRQDIDALLVSALYGELTPADEARLAAHLESHPADRATLDDLKTARAAVKQSRIFETQAEPPQAISAMLLQEAHRRAPKPSRVRDEGERESWFARFARSFFAHPAMAAAAMLVLVVGAAAIIHNRKGGDEMSVQSAPSAAGENDKQLDIDHPGQGAAPAAAPAEAPTGGAMGSASMGVALDEGKAELEQQVARDREKADQTASAGDSRNKLAVDKPMAHAAAPKSPPAVMAAEPDLQPKDVAPVRTPERAKLKKGGYDDPDTFGRMDNSEAATTRGANIGNGMAATQAPAPAPSAAPAAPPPPPMKTAPRQSAQIAAPGGTGGGGSVAGPTSATSAQDARARAQLAQALQFVKQDNCPEAAKLMVTIHDTAPAFYAQNVAGNRDLSRCASYAQDQIDKGNERSQKKAASKASDAVK